MAKLAYCKRCKATYPLNIVVNDGGTGRQDQGADLPDGSHRRQGSGYGHEAAWQEVSRGTPSPWSWRPPWWWPTS